MAIEPELRAYRNRSRVALRAGSITAIDRLLKRWRADGVLNKLDGLWLGNADVFQTGALNVAAAQYDLKIAGGGTFEAFAARFAPGNGFRGDGADFRLDTGVDASRGTTKFTAADSSMFLWSLTNSASLAYDMGITQGGVQAGIRVLTGIVFGGTSTTFTGGDVFVAPVGWRFGSVNPTTGANGSGVWYFNTVNRRVWQDNGTWVEIGNIAGGTLPVSTTLTDVFLFADGQDPFEVSIADAATAVVDKQVLFWDGTRYYIGVVKNVTASTWTIAYLGSSISPAKAGIFACNAGSSNVLVDSGRGFLAWSRLAGSTSVGVFNDGVKNVLAAFPIAGTPSGEMQLLGAQNSRKSSRNTIAAAGIGAGLTDAEMQSVYAGLAAYMNETGTITTLDPGSSIVGGAWTRADMDQVRSVNGANFRVYQQIPPPRSDAQDNASYAYFPVSDNDTMTIDTGAPEVTTQTQLRVHHRVWGMRREIPYVAGAPAFPNTRPNYQFAQLSTPLTPKSVPQQLTLGGVRCWTLYSTEAKSVAAVDVIFRYSLGLADTVPGETTNPLLMGWLDAARNAGFSDTDVVSFEYAQTNRATLYGEPRPYLQGIYRTATDKIILPQKRLVDVTNGAGMILDTEAQDGRTGDTLVAQLEGLAALCASRGKEFLAYPNALCVSDTNGQPNATARNGAGWTGFDINSAYRVHQIPNLRLTLLAQKTSVPIANALNAQIELLRGPTGNQPIDYSKLVLTVGIGTDDFTYTSDDLDVIRAFVQRGFSGVNFWRNYGQPSVDKSDLYNVIIARVLGIT